MLSRWIFFDKMSENFDFDST